MKTLPPAFGPFLTRKSPTATPRNTDIVSTGFAVEWATAEASRSIELFVSRGDGIFGDQLLVRHSDCPSDICIQRCATIRWGKLIYVFYEALLCWLYQQRFALRSRLEVLREISRLIPMRRPSLTEIPESGMLTQKAEAAGFLLTGVIPHEVLYADIGWRPYPEHDPLHAGIVFCQPGTRSDLKSCKWKTPDFTGMTQLMLPELEALAADPADLFSEAGRTFLTSELALLNQDLDLQRVKRTVAQNAAGQKPREKATRTGDSTASPEPH